MLLPHIRTFNEFLSAWNIQPPASGHICREHISRRASFGVGRTSKRAGTRERCEWIWELFLTSATATNRPQHWKEQHPSWNGVTRPMYCPSIKIASDVVKAMPSENPEARRKGGCSHTEMLGQSAGYAGYGRAVFALMGNTRKFPSPDVQLKRLPYAFPKPQAKLARS